MNSHVYLTVLIYVLAGTVKGLLGIGLPMTALGLTAQYSDPRTAIALVIMPMLVLNLWMMYRCGNMLPVIRRYWRLTLALLLSIGVFTQLATRIDEATLAGWLGFVVILFAVVNLWRQVPPVPGRWDHPLQWSVGLLSGVMGGIAGIWAPLVVMYLHAHRLDKDDFVRAIGWFLFVGSAALFVGYRGNGIISGQLALYSTALLIPALLGFAIGEQIRQRVSADRFRRLVLWFFLLLGMNLLRRGLGLGI